LTGGPQPGPGLIDTHLHLGRHEFGDEQSQILTRAMTAGVSRFMNIGFDLESSAYSARLAAGTPGVLAAVGIHPHDAALVADADGKVTKQGQAALDDIRDLAMPETTVAIGEIGLDFYRDLSPRPAQATAFRQQLALARDLDLPVVLHIRDAYDEAIAVLETAGLPPRRGVMHSFAGELSHAQWASHNGFLLGIGGPVTYKNSRLPGILEQVQLRDIILETDAPWLPPVPHRGQRNEPAYLTHTAAKVGQIMNVGTDELARITNENFDRVFLPGEGL
jgi:TatD DNase family protein